VGAVVGGAGAEPVRPPHPASSRTPSRRAAARTTASLPAVAAIATRSCPRSANASILGGVSIVAVVLLVAALVLLVAAEWPRVAGRTGLKLPHLRRRRRRKAQLRVVRSESDDFARSVERDLAALPTIDERDAKKR
jgi:hypothetical protein